MSVTSTTLAQLLGKQYESFKLFIWLYNSHILYQIGNETYQCNIIIWLCYVRWSCYMNNYIIICCKLSIVYNMYAREMRETKVPFLSWCMMNYHALWAVQNVQSFRREYKVFTGSGGKMNQIYYVKNKQPILCDEIRIKNSSNKFTFDINRGNRNITSEGSPSN